MRNRFLVLSILFIFSLFKAQNVGDFKSISSGTWTSSSIWNIWNGTAWVATTSYPGQTSGTYTVYVSSGNIVSTPSSNTTYSFGNLYVYGELDLQSNFTLTTTSKLLIDGGTVKWMSNNTTLTLTPTNATVSVLNYNGSNGIQTSGSCTNNRAIQIGTVKYAACTGGGNSDYIFTDINNAGGSITSVPTASSTQICSGSSTTLIGGHSGLVSSTPTYQWAVVSSPNSYTFPSGFVTSYSSTQYASGQNITLSQSGTYVFSLKVSTIGSNSGNTYSNTQTVSIIVDPLSVGGTASSNQTICSGSTPASLNLSGNTGTIQWQKSSDNSTFTDISGATASTLSAATMGSLASTTYYRAKITSGTCSSAYSNTVTITVVANPVGGTATSAQTICTGSQPSALTLSGYTGNIQWQKSTDNSNFSDISGATTATLSGATIGALSSTTYFRAKVSNSPCSDVYSNSITISVNSLPISGTASSDQTLCSGSQPSDITLSGYNGSIQWQKSTDNSTYTDIPGATSATLSGSTIGNLTGNTYIRAKVSNSPCSDMYSNVVTLDVINPTITGTLNITIGSIFQFLGSHIPAAINAWLSSNTAVATISSTGLVTAIARGIAVITYTTSSGCTATYTLNVGGCFEPPTSQGIGGEASTHGITDLGRAGNDNGNWPMIRKGAYTVLEAKSKGFVITRVSSTSSIATPVEGMIVYDDENDCLSIFNGSEWKCYKTLTCP